MGKFSERYGFSSKTLSIKSVDDVLKNKIWNYIYTKDFFKKNDELTLATKNQLNFFMCIKIGLELSSDDFKYKLDQVDKLKKWFKACKWYEVYNFIEIYLSYYKKNDKKKRIKELNQILVEEATGYRIVETGVVVSITNSQELQSINDATQTKYAPVNIAINKAIELFSNKNKSDYENSIKESISAVEALCCAILNKKATLGKALDELNKSGINIHHSMIEAMKKLYGYTSNSSGIRHGSIDFENATAEDAKYMLVVCSAFINYIIEKIEK